VWRAGLSRFLNCTLFFNLRYYGSFTVASTWHGYMIGLPNFLHWRQLPGLLGFLLVHALLPLVYVLFLLRYRRGSRLGPATGVPWDRLMLVACVGIALLLSVAPAPTWARLFYVSLPVLILFGWFLSLEGRVRRVVAAGLTIIATGLVVALPIAKQIHHSPTLALPAGRTAFLNRDALDRYTWVASHTKPSDYFFGGFYADFYFPLDLRNPGPVPFVTATQYTRPEEVQQVVAGLEKHHVHAALWALALDMPDDPQGDNLAPLRAYLRAHYHVVDKFPDFDALIRND
jgi:hypothetical protein